MTVEVLVHIYLQSCQSQCLYGIDDNHCMIIKKKILIGQIVFIFISFKVMNTAYNIKHQYNINFLS